MYGNWNSGQGKLLQMSVHLNYTLCSGLPEDFDETNPVYPDDLEEKTFCSLSMSSIEKLGKPAIVLYSNSQRFD